MEKLIKLVNKNKQIIKRIIQVFVVIVYLMWLGQTRPWLADATIFLFMVWLATVIWIYEDHKNKRN